MFVFLNLLFHSPSMQWGRILPSGISVTLLFWGLFFMSPVCCGTLWNSNQIQVSMQNTHPSQTQTHASYSFFRPPDSLRWPQLLLVYSLHMHRSAVSIYVVIEVITSSRFTKEKREPGKKCVTEKMITGFLVSTVLSAAPLFPCLVFFCCAPDTNENVLWDLNQFWMNDLLHWFITGAVI